MPLRRELNDSSDRFEAAFRGIGARIDNLLSAICSIEACLRNLDGEIRNISACSSSQTAHFQFALNEIRLKDEAVRQGGGGISNLGNRSRHQIPSDFAAQANIVSPWRIVFRFPTR